MDLQPNRTVTAENTSGIRSKEGGQSCNKDRKKKAKAGVGSGMEWLVMWTRSPRRTVVVGLGLPSCGEPHHSTLHGPHHNQGSHLFS